MIAWLLPLLLVAADEPTSQPASQAMASGFLDDGDAPPAAPSDGDTSDEAQPSSTATVVEPPSRVAWYRGIDVNGFVEAGFAVLLPGGNNTFFVGEAELDIERRFFDVARLHVDANLTQRRPWQPAGGLGLVFNSPAATIDTLLEQAFVEFFPLGDWGPKLRLGKYNALIAHERLDPNDRSLVSQSLVFIHGSPANFTGLAVEAPELFGFRLTLHAAFNGWDQGISTTPGKSFGGKLAYHHAFAAPWTIDASFATLYSTNNFAARDHRLAFFGELSISYNKQLQLAAEGTYGKQSGAEWYGVSAFIDWTFLSWLGAAMRYDYFGDPQRVRLLLLPSNPLAFARRQQLTVGLHVQPFEGGTLRAEYTADFPGGALLVATAIGSSSTTQHRVALTALLAF